MISMEEVLVSYIQHEIRKVFDNLKREDFIKTVTVGEKEYDVYNFIHPVVGKSVIAVRFLEDREVEATFERTLTELTKTLAMQCN